MTIESTEWQPFNYGWRAITLIFSYIIGQNSTLRDCTQQRIPAAASQNNHGERCCYSTACMALYII